MSSSALSARRGLAVKLFAAGIARPEVARRCGVSRQTAMRWQRAYEQAGADGLAAKLRGRPPKLSEEQRQALQAALLEGPTSHGWTTELWTLERVSVVTRRLFGVRYHRGHVWKLLRWMGWSLQRPTTRARERDEAAIARWKSHEWPRLKKTVEHARPSSSSTKAASPKAR